LPTFDEKILKKVREHKAQVKTIVKRLYSLPKNAKENKERSESLSQNPYDTEIKNKLAKTTKNVLLKRNLSLEFPRVRYNPSKLNSNYLNKDEFINATLRVKDYLNQKEDLKNMIRNSNKYD